LEPVGVMSVMRSTRVIEKMGGDADALAGPVMSWRMK